MEKVRSNQQRYGIAVTDSLSGGRGHKGDKSEDGDKEDKDDLPSDDDEAPSDDSDESKYIYDSDHSYLISPVS